MKSKCLVLHQSIVQEVLLPSLEKFINVRKRIVNFGQLRLRDFMSMLLDIITRNRSNVHNAPTGKANLTCNFIFEVNGDI